MFIASVVMANRVFYVMVISLVDLQALVVFLIVIIKVLKLL